MPGPAPVIETSRLILRPHRLADADAITQSLSDIAVTRMMARVPAPFDRKDALDWLIPHSAGLSESWALAVTERDDVHIGVVSLELRHGCWHLGYWLNRYFWRRGIMTEAVGAFTDFCFEEFQLRRMYTEPFANNAASARVLEKAGFALEGRLKNNVLKDGKLLDSLLYARIR